MIFRNLYFKRIAIILLFTVVVVGIQVIVSKLYPDDRIERLEATHDEILRRLESIEKPQRNSFTSAIDRAKQAIVHIITYNTEGNRSGGAGILIDKNKGYILTNYHVIKNKNVDQIEVIFPNSDYRKDIARGISGAIVGYDRLSDLALLKSMGMQGRPEVDEIEWGNSKNLQVGEWAIAIGYPYAPVAQANPTITAGIISATSRNFLGKFQRNRLHTEMIQTDVSINPGNSGGALVNIHGQLIGINTFIRTTSGGSQGIGFAVPANNAKKVVEQLIAHGCVIPPYLGIHTQPLTSDLIKKTGIPYGPGLSAFSSPRGFADDGMPNYSGVYVADIDEGSPADNAGLKVGDFISSRRRSEDEPPEPEATAIFNGVAPIETAAFDGVAPIENERHFKTMTRLLPINQKIYFFFRRPIINPNSHFERSGTTYFQTIFPLSTVVELRPKVLQWNYTPLGWGITFKQPNREEAGKYKKHRGIIVTSIAPESPLGIDLRSGDLIYKIISQKVEVVNRQKKPLVEFEIHSLEEFTIYAPMLTSGELFWFHFERDGKNKLALITIPNVSLKKVLASPESWQKAVERMNPSGSQLVNPLKPQ